MDDSKQECVTKDIVEAGKTVTVIATLVGGNNWELSINGKWGQFTTWTDYFSSSESALEAGFEAILKEGIDEFYSNEEFPYLDEP